MNFRDRQAMGGRRSRGAATLGSIKQRYLQCMQMFGILGKIAWCLSMGKALYSQSIGNSTAVPLAELRDTASRNCM